MYAPARRYLTVLLTLTLLALPVAAHADPAAGAAERWITSVLDTLGDLVEGLWSIGATSETDAASDPVESDDTEVAPAGDGTDSGLILTTGAYPTWDPNG